MAELEAREAAARARAEALRARIAVLAEQLTAEEELRSRLGITRQMVLEILGGGDEHGSGAVELDGDASVGAALRVDSPIARAGLEGAPAAVRVGEGAPAAVRVGAVTVPQWQAGVAEAVLPVAYRDVLEVLAAAGRPLRARQIAAALGLGEQPRGVEGLRLKLKRLVKRGWLAEPEAGLFVCGDHPTESA
jgi:hypothetical protein